MSTTVLATFVTRQLVFDGAVNGAVVGLVAIGIVLVYRSTRVINFAVANMGLVATGLLSLLAVQYDVPFWIAFPVSLAVGTIYGMVVELTVVRRLFTAPRVILLIATIGVAQLSLAIAGSYPDLDDLTAPFPTPISGGRDILGLEVDGPQLSIVLVVPLVAVGLAWFLNRTIIGQTVKASAENPELARLSTINPKTTSTLVWGLAGLLASLSMSLLGGLAPSANSLTGIGPPTLARALAAAVIAGMASFPRALAAGVGIGVLEAILRFNFLDSPTLIDLIVFVMVLVAVWFQSRRFTETAVFSFTPRARPVPAELHGSWWLRNVNGLGLALLGGFAVVLPFVVDQPSRILTFGTILTFAICALSVSMLTGWAGQLSLAQMAFAGLGALLAAAFQRGLVTGLGWADTELLTVELPAVPFGVAILLAAASVAGLASLIGLASLRVRGLLLAVSTLAFGLAAQQYLYARPFLSDGRSSGSVPLQRGSLFGIDLDQQRPYYLFLLLVTFVVVVIVCRLRRSGIGRSTVAVRDNESTASAYTISPVGAKVRVFALSGALAALGGGLLGGLVGNVPLSNRLFTVNESLMVVAIAVIGGLGTVAGPLLGSAWVVGLPALFPDNELLPLFSSSIGLLILLMYVPGGVMQVVYSVRDGYLARSVERRPGEATNRREVAAPTGRTQRTAPVPPADPWLRCVGLTVGYGGVRAVDDVSIEVGPREVVGLIGTNGAGKSSVMNAISGFVPSGGRVELMGADVSALRPHERARLGLGRTFQAATLFPELTVRETVMVALEARARTALLPTAAALPPATRAERRKRASADELIDLLGLGRFADVTIGDLSTGTRRIVELAGLLALDARVLCLDEPTAGVAQRETEAFGPLLTTMARELDAAVLIIEHDMPLIMSISDRVYCLALGAVIADGPPATVRSDPQVIASYLGLDHRAIERSDSALSSARRT